LAGHRSRRTRWLHGGLAGELVATQAQHQETLPLILGLPSAALHNPPLLLSVTPDDR
jgi:hypothetical protein